MEMQLKIQEIMDKEINPVLGAHNGSAAVSYIEDGVVGIKLFGACASCMSATDTFDTVIKEKLINAVPEIKDIVIDDSVSRELLDFARSILGGEKILK